MMRERDKMALGVIAMIAALIAINAFHCEHTGNVLAGVWRLESVQMNGEPPQRERELWVFRGGTLTIVSDDEARDIWFSTDPQASPKQLDTDVLIRRTGIYEVSGDTLRVAQVNPLKPRPTEFKTEWGDMRIVSVLRRMDADPQLTESALRKLLVAVYGARAQYPKRMEFDQEAEAFITALMRDIYDKGGEKLSAKEEVVSQLSRLIAEVDNGGFHQYFYNGTGEHAVETAALLRRIGAPETAALVSAGCRLFPAGAPPKDYDQRRAELDRFTLDQYEALRDLQERFYARREDLHVLLKKFWESQP